MSKNLVIVESPAKAKTIEKFLGSDYTVMSSFGHIRDLEEKKFGVEIGKNSFKPIYVVSSDKKKIVGELKKNADSAEVVWLASDEDREGEAIAWHLFETLKLKKDKTRRIVFHEITKPAILKAIENPRDIDYDLVNAQQARRVLDRIVGFELSPVLWKKVRSSLSAGRVQSVAVRLIVDREREIQAFVSEAAFRVVATFTVLDKDGKSVELKAELQQRFKTTQEALAFLEKCKESHFSIDDIVTKPAKRSPAPPFTTSTLQQEAARKLGYSVSQTMMIAQKLYEAGQITYMRTDSVNLSDLALNTSKKAILDGMGEKYWKLRRYHTQTKGAQEAHEAIRPTYMDKSEISGTAQEKNLYSLIWKRTIASQMSDAELERTTVTIGINNTPEKFISTGEVIKFDGFLRVYMESTDDDAESDAAPLLPPLKVKQPLDMKQIVAQERFTQRPPRYNEASLVRKLEELGIGRPSTYAPTISTIQKRKYVEKSNLEGEMRNYELLTLTKGKIKKETKSERFGADKGKLTPTDIGMVVNDFLTDYFPSILDYNFTANVEKEFDDIAEGALDWQKSLDEFYKEFHPTVEKAVSQSVERRTGERILGTDPKTGRQVSVRIGRFGPMVQIGTKDDEEKPLFASLAKGQMIDTITFEEAMELFKLPRMVGKFEEKDMVASIGRFGAYVRHDSKFYSLPKTENPLSITAEAAIELIKSKREADKNKEIKVFSEDTDMKVLNGRYGPYIAYKKKNFKIPSKKIPADLTYQECLAIVNGEVKEVKKSSKTAKPAWKKKK